MQATYSMDPKTGDDWEAAGMQGIQIIGLFGDLLLAIRKSVGNEATGLTNIEMLEWMITDIRSVEDQLRDL